MGWVVFGRAATRIAAVFLMVALAVPAFAGEPGRGHLILVGGGDKPDEAMKKFVELAGGPQAPIVVIPTASSEKDAGSYYFDLFTKDYGCSDVTVLDVKNTRDAARPDYVAAARRARGIFFGGGDQIRILDAFENTPLLAALREAHERGAVVGGTSAGTACQSRIMITGEGDFKVIRSRSVEVWNGLGFLPDEIVIDQHFIARQRSNRLLSVILEHPDHLGVGVDEDTAIWFRPDGTFQVMGLSSVMVLDAEGAAVSRQAKETGQDLLGVHGLRLQILLPGEVFDTKSRSVVAARAAEGGTK